MIGRLTGEDREVFIVLATFTNKVVTGLSGEVALSRRRGPFQTPRQPSMIIDGSPVFGSVAHGQARRDFDIALLVEAPEGTSSCAFVRFKELLA